jgi:protein gp37
MQRCPQHQFLILTKRPERMQAWAQTWGKPLRHVWLGVSCENQATAETRIPLLLQTPAALRFVSYEPALVGIDFRQITLRSKRQVLETINALSGHGMHYTGALGYCAHLDWVICGGESGPQARPMDLAWLRRVVKDCHEAHVPVWLKQDSGGKPGQQGRIPDALWVHELPQSGASVAP